MVFGIADKPPRDVVGTAICFDPVHHAQNLYDALKFRIEITVVAHPDGGRVVVFTIPPRPSGTAYNLDGSYFMRAGEALVAMSEDQLRCIFDEGNQPAKGAAAPSRRAKTLPPHSVLPASP